MRRCLIPFLVLAVSACDTPDPSTPDMLGPDAPAAALIDAPTNVLDVVNATLADRGAPVRVGVAELLLNVATAGPNPTAQTIFAKDVGNKQLGHHFVPGDPGRVGVDDITYAIDGTEAVSASGLAAAATIGAIDRAMATWEAEACSDVEITRLGVAPFDLGFVQAALGFGGVFGWVADVTHAGWLPAGFFDALAPDGSQFILGVTFTLLWNDEDGNFIDSDGNKKLDVAFREIYYNDAFPWRTDGGHIDVESVALHESGHALSQAHFGTIALLPNGGLRISPQAVMNAGYTAVRRSLLGTDRGGHCSIWATWP